MEQKSELGKFTDVDVVMSVDGNPIHNIMCYVSKDYINLSWDDFGMHLSGTKLSHQEKKAQITGDKQVTVYWKGDWDGTPVNWPIVMDFHTQANFEHARSSYIGMEPAISTCHCCSCS